MILFWTEIVELVSAAIMLAMTLSQFKKNLSPCRTLIANQLAAQKNQWHRRSRVIDRQPLSRTEFA